MLHFECKTYIFGGPSSETRITTSSWWPGHVGQFKCERRYGSKRPEGCFVDNKDRDRGAKQQQCLLAVIVRVVSPALFFGASNTQFWATTKWIKKEQGPDCVDGRGFLSLELPLNESNARDSMVFHALIRMRCLRSEKRASEKHLFRPLGRRLWAHGGTYAISIVRPM